MWSNNFTADFSNIFLDEFLCDPKLKDIFGIQNLNAKFITTNIASFYQNQDTEKWKNPSSYITWNGTGCKT